MAVADRHGLPVAVHVESATPHEVKLVVPTLVEMVIPEAPQNLVGDNAYLRQTRLRTQQVRCTTHLSTSQHQEEQNPRSATTETLPSSLED